MLRFTVRRPGIEPEVNSPIPDPSPSGNTPPPEQTFEGEKFLPEYYAELRRMAKTRLAAERQGHTLQATALVHEAYMRIARQDKVDWSSRSQVLTLAAWMMRRILVDYAKSRKRQRRGDGVAVQLLDRQTDFIEEANPDIERLDLALTDLAALDPRQASIVEMRYFSGLSVEETAAALGISTATVKREWRTARLWLSREISR